MNTPIIVVENLYSSFGADNADYLTCPKTNKEIYFITDGHSQRNGSADLVDKFEIYLTANFNIELIDEENVEVEINKCFSDFREATKRVLPRAAMCFVLVVKINNFLHVFHLGDCRLGRFSHNGIEWITEPHLVVLQDQPGMTEEELRLNEYNHIVYKLFSVNKPRKPDYFKYEIDGSEYILATDGFWKLTQEKQQLLLNNKFTQLSDDVAFIRFSISSNLIK
ncbi:hypothetical protein [Acinetobacter venetianus]|uniref:PPM-type phosphatase domain-containing protein n=1 Tax=Acinetobacter venetianus TaxID=52133 RepID=A0A150HXH8_9GAMM|nr:hypothetical protein [Acinetobacter venetianus]KXZ71495.1 hypothetical protein AVENLUH13518_01070 [Acinetobacter venetianus]